MSLCSVNISGTPTGATCVTYANCNATCCIASYTECSGSNTADCTSCVSETTCCNYADPSCGGDSSTWPCLTGYETEEECNAQPCCLWNYEMGACSPRACSIIVFPLCATCGCYPIGGYCYSKTCSVLTEANCPTCGCTSSGTCTARTCAQVAAINNNPDVCAGCDTCGGEWAVDNDRGNLPWTVYTTTLSLAGSGAVNPLGAATLVIG